jgi:hypothetical protein
VNKSIIETIIKKGEETMLIKIMKPIVAYATDVTGRKLVAQSMSANGLA